MVGIHNVARVVTALTEMMASLGADHAHVGKAGSTILVHVYRKDDWVGTMKVKR